MVALVLAGGIGKRFDATGQRGAKQLAAVDDRGHTLTDYALYDAWLSGVDEVVAVVSPEGQTAFADGVGKRISKVMRVRYAVQSPPTVYGFDADHPPLGTGHAFLCGASGVKSPMIVLNADDFYGRDAIRAAVQCAMSGDYGVVSYPVGATVGKEPVHRGICLMEEGEFAGVCECTFSRDGAGKLYAEDASCRRYVSERTPVSMNLFALQPAIVATAAKCFAEHLRTYDGKECYLGDIVTTFIGRTHPIVRHIPAKGEWMGLTYRSDLARVRRRIDRLVERDVYPKCLWTR